MAQYKVLQDIEAEDKLLGPLSLRQFIYAVIVVVLGFVGFKLGTIRWYIAVPFLPPIIFFGLLAAPLGRDQPSEVWLLAKIRFFIRGRKRIWDQTGVKELVTITVPKKIERVVSKGFSQQEKSSRLKALAATMDTRGWAVKNIDTQAFQHPMFNQGADDRLVAIAAVPQDDATVDPDSDILDENNNPIAQHVDETLKVSTQAHREELLSKVRDIATTQRLNDPNNVRTAKVSDRLQSIVADIEKQQAAAEAAQANMRRLEPLPGSQATASSPAPAPAQPTQAPQTTAQTTQQTAVTPPSDPGILKLVKNNDLNVATVGREANRKKANDEPEGEVVIPLR